jgi:hypothetical protein
MALRLGWPAAWISRVIGRTLAAIVRLAHDPLARCVSGRAARRRCFGRLDPNNRVGVASGADGAGSTGPLRGTIAKLE